MSRNQKVQELEAHIAELTARLAVAEYNPRTAFNNHLERLQEAVLEFAESHRGSRVHERTDAITDVYVGAWLVVEFTRFCTSEEKATEGNLALYTRGEHSWRCSFDNLPPVEALIGLIAGEFNADTAATP
jgi:3-phosphoglycerate kinase